jgi:hypothetical protein
MATCALLTTVVAVLDSSTKRLVDKRMHLLALTSFVASSNAAACANQLYTYSL